MDVQALIHKLSKFYWSKSHPSTYTLRHPVSGAKVGLGVIAHKNYAAFNLTVAIHDGRLQNLEQHWEASGTHGAIRHILEKTDSHVVEGALTLLTPEEFSKWYISNARAVNKELRPWIEDALTNIKAVREL